MEATWPLCVVAGTSVVLGVVFLGDPAETRDFFARLARSVQGDAAGERFRRMPPGLYRALALMMVVAGLGFGLIAAGAL